MEERLVKLIQTLQSYQMPNIPLSPFQIMILAFAIMGVIYTFLTPVFEGSDELEHYALIEAYANNQVDDSLFAEIGTQPPLSYEVTSWILSAVNPDNINALRQPNPYVSEGLINSFDNKNLVLHDVEGGSATAIYVLRLLNIALGLGSIWLVYESAKLVVGQRKPVALLAVGLMAFNPMFLYVSASVNNISLSILLNSLVVYFLLRLTQTSFALPQAILLALSVGLAGITAIGGWVLLPITLVALLWMGYRTKKWGQYALSFGLVAINWGIFASWWYVNNFNDYESILGIAPEIVTSTSQTFSVGYWGLFGANNIVTFGLFYALITLILLFALVGFVFLLLQLFSIRDFTYARRELAQNALILGMMIVAFIIVQFVMPVRSGYLLPFASIVSIFLAIGLGEVIWWILFFSFSTEGLHVAPPQLVPERILRFGMLYPIGFLGMVALFVPLTNFSTWYAQPEPIEELPANAQQVYAEYGDIALVGYILRDSRYNSGDTIPVTLYWQVLETSDRDYTVAIGLHDHLGRVFAGHQSYPGGGLLRTSQWKQGDIFADRYQLTIPRSLTSRLPLYLQVRWFDHATQTVLEPHTADGQALGNVSLNAGILFPTRLQISVPEHSVELEDAVEFSEMFRLVAYQIIGDEVTIVWEANQTIIENYVAFVHLVDENGQLVAQSDVTPKVPTRYLRDRERFLTEHTLEYFLNSEEPIIANIGWYTVVEDEITRLTIDEDMTISHLEIPFETTFIPEEDTETDEASASSE